MDPIERAVLVGCSLKTDDVDLDSSLDELARLVETAKATPMARVTQVRDHYDATWLIGKGKVDEISALVEDQGIDLVVFDQELSPRQLIRLEERIPCKIIDRTQLILDIFAMRAQTKEGSLQVELAQLEYMYPRLVGKGTQLSRLGGGIGTRGPGEKKLETDRRHIRGRIHDLKRDLEQVRKHRQLHQSRRRKMEIVQVALVGYTNAGKSTLLNRLTGSEVLEEDQLFATLDPTSRFLELPSGEKILLTDTVGFIRNLPHHLVAAFRSTLEQVQEADLLLHVVDQSHPEAASQMTAVHQVLKDLSAEQVPMVTVFNKRDRESKELLTAEGETVHISAFEENDLIKLKEKISQVLYDAQIAGSAEIPVDRGEMISQLYEVAEVLHSEVNDLTMTLQFRLPRKRYERMSPEIKACIREVREKN
ncbi:GTPase HflX [Marininema halotolerans]|uniref:GTPase HflX n=1 Tax=Marininema halotolerans TaxID=1155944 RepID=A0A1I6R6X0_9BACL|nr:GTPase HflX [Marininema halotolerans]SFS60414.1 GTP-binding protein HflX [Marininema halotolerans]